MPVGDSEDPEYLGEKRHSPHIALGLYLAAASIGLETGLDGVFAMMEPRLCRHLRRYGIRFQQAGGVMDYHGERAAYYITRKQLLEGLHPEIQMLLDMIHHDLASGIRQAKY
jgi:N-acyl amino acid synthase of PEP-CTERM/exosortase system